MKHTSLNNINKTGFKVPKDYFENFEDLLLSELKLKEASTNHGFKVPENYFENLETQILNTVHKKQPKVIHFIAWRKIAYAAAAAAILLMMFNVIFTNNKNLNIENIETASIENYILTEGLETSDVASLFTDEDLSEISSIKTHLNPETLENYVLDYLEIEDLITNTN
ncbi:hypothetical protein [Yeosuana sp. AK3]